MCWLDPSFFKTFDRMVAIGIFTITQMEILSPILPFVTIFYPPHKSPLPWVMNTLIIKHEIMILYFQLNIDKLLWLKFVVNFLCFRFLKCTSPLSWEVILTLDSANSKCSYNMPDSRRFRKNVEYFAKGLGKAERNYLDTFHEYCLWFAIRGSSVTLLKNTWFGYKCKNLPQILHVLMNRENSNLFLVTSNHQKCVIETIIFS